MNKVIFNYILPRKGALMEFNVKLTGYAILTAVLLFAGALIAQPTLPLCAELVHSGYDLVGDTLDDGTVLSGFVLGHSAHLEFTSDCAETGTQYRFFRTPWGASTPDLQTDWLPLSYTNMDGAGDGDVFKYTAAVTDGDSMVYSNPLGVPDADLWLMHDWYRPDCVEGIFTDYYDSPSRIRIDWRKGTDSASGIYKYYIYRSNSYGSLEYISPTMAAIDSVLDNGSSFLTWSDYEVTPDQCYWYVIVPMDKAGRVRRDDNSIFRSCASGITPPWPPCAILRPIDRYHTGSGVTVRINLDACPGSAGEIVQYRYRNYGVYNDVSGDPAMYMIDETDWTDTPFYFFSTMECSTYTYSAQARYLGHAPSPWSHLGPMDPLTTNDQTAPGCLTEMVAVSYGEEGIWVHFEQDPTDDCGSGILGYHLFRFPADSITDHLPPDSSDLADYELHTYYVDSAGLYTYQDDGPTDPVIDLEDNVTYYYVVCPFDSVGWTNWLDCGDGQIDTATVDKGVAGPLAISLPAYHCDGYVTVEFIDTTHCDATQVEFHWSASPDFEGASFVGVGPVPIDSATTIGSFSFSNPADEDCTDWDTLTITLDDLYETHWFFRARFFDQFGNVSVWSNVVNTRIDNTAPTTTNIINVQSFADSVNTVDVLINWDPSVFDDGDGIGLDSVDIYRSTTVGDIGTAILTVSIFENKFIDGDPDPASNWHDNVYKVVPRDYCGHQNTEGIQGYFSGFGQHPPAVPRIDTVLVSHYLDSFTIVWSDTGISPMSTKYVLRHGGTEGWLWIGDTIIAPNTHLGIVPSHSATFPIEDLLGGPRHFFIMCAEDGEVPANQSGWSEVFEFELDTVLNVTDTIHITAGWNFISLPVMPADNNASVLFPGGLDYYEWNPIASIYEDVTVLEPGHAYWVLMSSTADYPVTGIPVVKVEREAIGPGFWTVGAPHDTLETSIGSGYDWDGTGWLTTLYEYNDGYITTDRLEMGKGYWLLLTGIGDFFTEWNMPKALMTSNPEVEWSFDVDASGTMLEVAFSENSEIGIDRADLVLPPPTPSGEIEPSLIDNDGFRYIRSVRPDGEWTIFVNSETELSWKIDELPALDLRIETGFGTFDMHETGSAIVIGSAKIVASGKLPSDYALGQNIPNPFNATCAVPFTMLEDGDVRIRIFDIAGRSIATLIDDEISAGEHSVIWDGKDEFGRDMPGGIYLCRMEAGSFSANRRMLLVK